MRIITRAIVPAFVLALALLAPIAASAQSEPLTVQTAIGPLRVPTISGVGAGETCQEAKDNALAQLTADYFIFGVTYGPCICSDVTDPFTGEVFATLCSVKVTCMGFRKFFPLP